ncbi:Probable aspartic protease At2g35615 [Linum grandiflorum]
MSSLQILLISLLLIVTAKTKTSSTAPIVAQLIHRDSTISPLYNPRETKSDRQQRIERISEARLASYYSQSQKNRHGTNAAFYSSSLVRSDVGLLYVSFDIGQPPTQLLAFMDVGSSLLWVSCMMDPAKQISPLYDPERSSTLRYLRCDSETCTNYPSKICDISGTFCGYRQSYADGSLSRGWLATEQFGFPNSSFLLKDVVFGCSSVYTDRERFDDRFSGVFALGAGVIFVVKDKVFSYCLGDVNHKDYKFHYLVLMDELDNVIDKSTSQISATKMKNDGGHYALELYSIQMEDGKELLPLDDYEPFTNVILDSGSLFSYFPPSILYPLRNQVDKVVNRVFPNTRELRAVSDDQLCYLGDVENFKCDDLTVTLYVEGGAKFVWRFDSILYQDGENRVCMSVRSSTKYGDISIIGLMGQQNHKLTFDMKHGVLYIDQAAPCQ